LQKIIHVKHSDERHLTADKNVEAEKCIVSNCSALTGPPERMGTGQDQFLADFKSILFQSEGQIMPTS